MFEALSSGALSRGEAIALNREPGRLLIGGLAWPRSGPSRRPAPPPVAEERYGERSTGTSSDSLALGPGTHGRNAGSKGTVQRGYPSQSMWGFPVLELQDVATLKKGH